MLLKLLWFYFRSFVPDTTSIIAVVVICAV